MKFSYKIGASIFGLFAVATVANAEDFFIAQTVPMQGSNISAACLAAPNPHTIDWLNAVAAPYPANWGNGPDKVGPGDTIHLCGTISTPLITQGNGSAGNPITILFEPGARMSRATWSENCGTGIKMCQALSLDAGSNYHAAIAVINGNSHFVIDGGQDGIIEASGNGTLLPYQQGVIRGIAVGNNDVSNDIEIKNLEIRNLYVRVLQNIVVPGSRCITGPDNNPVCSGNPDAGSGTGVYVGGGSDISIHDNILQDMANPIQVAFMAAPGELNNLSIYNNQIRHMSWGIQVGSGRVAWDQPEQRANGVFIHDNILTDETVWGGWWWNADANSWDRHHNNGIYTWAQAHSRMTNMQIYNNLIGGSWTDTATASIFVLDNIDDSFVFNNVIYEAGGLNSYITANSGGKNQVIANNTIIGTGAGSGSGVSDSGQQTLPLRTSGVVQQNNLFYRLGLPIILQCGSCTPAQNTVSGILNVMKPQIASIDYNLYYNDPGREFQMGFISLSLADWRTASGFDAQSIFAEPTFANLSAKNYRPTATSAVESAGKNLSSYCNVAPALCRDFEGRERPKTGPWDIGAFEYCPTCPVLPPVANPRVPASPDSGGTPGSTPPGSTGQTVESQFLPFKNVFNPIVESLVIKFLIVGGGDSSLFVYDRLGNEIRKLEKSSNQATWDGRNSSGRLVASGTYILVLKQGGEVLKRKVIVVK